MNKNDKKYETNRNLRVHYTDAERLELGKQLASVHQELAQTNSDFDSVKSDFKARLTSHEAKISDLAQKVSNGYCIKEVKCLWVMDTPQSGKKLLLRMDTQDTVEVEEMTAADAQAELKLEDTKAGVDAQGNVTVAADRETPIP